MQIYRRQMWVIITLTVVAGILAIAVLRIPQDASTGQSPPAVTPWPQSYVENQWALPHFGEGHGRMYFQASLGWDETKRYYAALLQSHPGMKNTIGVIDRVTHAICTIETYQWTGGDFYGRTYEINMFGDGGWSEITTLDLATWEISVRVYGRCTGPDQCEKIEHPQPELLGVCETGTTYAPVGLY